MEYYNQDIQVLKKLGHNVIICNSYLNLPLNFDIVFIWWWTYALFPVLFAKILGKKTIITGVFNFKKINSLENSGFFARPLYQRMLIKIAAKITDVNLFVSKLEFDEVPVYFNLKNSFYAPCVIGDIYFNNSNNESRDGILNIAWSGKDNLKRKGVYDIVYALKILKDRGFFVKCTMAGRPGDGFGELKQKIKELNLENQIKTIGEVSLSEKLNLYANSLIYVQPSYFEGFGLATAEALSSGCCVIACDVGEVKNVLGNCAIYITPGNHIELADAIYISLSDSNLRSSLISKGQKMLFEIFSQEKKSDTLNKILSTLFR